jgi:hypothetical protein
LASSPTALPAFEREADERERARLLAVGRDAFERDPVERDRLLRWLVVRELARAVGERPFGERAELVRDRLAARELEGRAFRVDELLVCWAI